MKGSRQMLQASSVSSSEATTKAVEEEEEEPMAGLKGDSDNLKAES